MCPVPFSGMLSCVSTPLHPLHCSPFLAQVLRSQAGSRPSPSSHLVMLSPGLVFLFFCSFVLFFPSFLCLSVCLSCLSSPSSASAYRIHAPASGLHRACIIQPALPPTSFHFLLLPPFVLLSLSCSFLLPANLLASSIPIVCSFPDSQYFSLPLLPCLLRCCP